MVKNSLIAYFNITKISHKAMKDMKDNQNL